MIRTAVALSMSLILTACGSAGTAPSPRIVTYEVEQITSTDPSLPDLNQIRAKFGLQPLSVSATATRVAQKHAQDMATNNFFSHRGSDGSTGVSRLTAAGCRGTRAENIAKGRYHLVDDHAAAKIHIDRLTGIGASPLERLEIAVWNEGVSNEAPSEIARKNENGFSQASFVANMAQQMSI